MLRNVLHSKEMPKEFFDPAVKLPLHSLMPSVEKRLRHLRTATVSLRRVIITAGGLSWILLLLQEYDQLLYPNVDIFRVFLLCISIVMFAVGMLKVERLYQPFMGIAVAVYFLLLVVHCVSLFLNGESPLAALKLGDYSAIPAALFVAACPGIPAILVSLCAVAVAAAVNLGTVPGFQMFVEIAHALAPVVPFVILVSAGLQTTRIIDAAAARVHQDAIVIANQKALNSLETRFLAFIHDHVLTQLSALWRGTVTVDLQQMLRDIEKIGEDSVDGLSEITYANAIRQVSDAVLSEYPATQITFPSNLTESGTLPATAVVALVDAARQGAANVAKHAEDSNAALSFTIGTESLNISLKDDGSGFSPKILREDHRAGIRVSILDRLKQTKGCHGNVLSAPGQGTEVLIGWGAGHEYETSDTDTLPSVYESMGFAKIFRPLPAVIAWVLFVSISLSNQHPIPLLWAGALICVALALWSLIQQPHKRLPRRYVYLTCLFIWSCYALAIGEDAPDETAWPFFWAPWVVVLLCVYLAMRNRPLSGWAAWLGCLVIAQIAVLLGADSSYISPAQSWTHSLVLLPASILPWMVKRISDGMPLLLRAQGASAAAGVVNETRDRFLQESTTWLTTRIHFLFQGPLTAEQKTIAAHIMEQRLRDSIRSPLLDRPAITAATWDARLRGATVKLLDDYSSTHLDSGESSLPGIERVEKALVEILQITGPNGSMVVRLLPQGRDHIATIVMSDEETGHSDRIFIA